MLIKDKELKIPLIQGGMGVGISLGVLAGSVAKSGGMGVISTADIGFHEDDFWENHKEANKRALKKEIEKARKIASGNGMIAINAMVATEDYEEIVSFASECGVDAVISGAGLPLKLPCLVSEKTAIAPIVSSGKAAALISKAWNKHYSRKADFVVLEGYKAGGHLGFSMDNLKNGSVESNDEILPRVLEALEPYKDDGNDIPVFVAGGVKTKEDVDKFLSMGASGVQIGTRFILTNECDASYNFKEVIRKATKEDVKIILSPVGMPGRAVNSPLLDRAAKGEKVFPKKCIRCLKGCNPSSAPYCITAALISAVNGDVESGLFFSGSEVGNFKEITSVEKVIEEFFGTGSGK